MPVESGPLLKLQFGGALFGVEQWACSVHLVGTQDGDFPGGTDLAPLEAPLKDWFSRPTSNISQGATLTFAKLNQIARGPVGPNLPGGKQDPAKATNAIIFIPVGTPPAANGLWPGQCSSAVTLLTDLSRGRGSKGRFYPPTVAGFSNGNNVGGDGRLQTNIVLDMANSAQELLSEINALFGVVGPLRTGTVPECVVCVWSSLAQVARGVDRVAVGRVVDTQRRRRSSLDEDTQLSTAAV